MSVKQLITNKITYLNLLIISCNLRPEKKEEAGVVIIICYFVLFLIMT